MGNFSASAGQAVVLYKKIKDHIGRTDDQSILMLQEKISTNLEKLNTNLRVYKDETKDNRLSEIIGYISDQDSMFKTLQVDSDYKILSHYRKLENRLTAYVEELNKDDLKRVTLKSEFKKISRDEKSAIDIKIDWTLTNYEMKSKHNIEALAKETFELQNKDEIKTFIIDHILCFQEFNADMERMKLSVSKKLQKFYHNHYLRFQFSDHETVEVASLDSDIGLIKIEDLTQFNSVELSIVLSDIFDKLSFFPFAKKKKMIQLEDELKRILSEYTHEVSRKVHRALEAYSQTYYNSIFNNIDTSFEQTVCKSDMTGYVIRSLNDCISSVHVPDMHYSVKEILLNRK